MFKLPADELRVHSSHYLARKAHKIWDYGRQCAGHLFLVSKHNVNLLNIWVHMHLQCAQRGKVLEFSWRVESGSRQLEIHL